MDGLPKDKVLEVLKPHIFFDDQLRHLTSESVPSVLVPFGINSVTFD
ncbi:MAG: 5'-nucleotidase [Mesosutterella sp.]|nr:5'-nucleotidase [Mesosutterella sp.]